MKIVFTQLLIRRGRHKQLSFVQVHLDLSYLERNEATGLDTEGGHGTCGGDDAAGHAETPVSLPFHTRA